MKPTKVFYRVSVPIFVTAVLFGGTAANSMAAPAPAPVTADQANQIAVDAYIYAYPLVLMDVTRKVLSNAGEGAPKKSVMAAPMNEFLNMPAFPDASFTDVVRPNADTLYSSMWFDVSREPLIVSIPDSGGRYYLLPMLDMWTDIFASPGKRTTGTKAQAYALIGPGWKGQLPSGVAQIKCPTPTGWIIGRTQTNGKKDYDAVHQFQAGLKAIPLSAWGQGNYTPPKATFNPNQNMSAPVEQVAKLSPADFFADFAELLKSNPPHDNDNPILEQMARIGIVRGKSFDVAQASPEVKAAIEAAPGIALPRIMGYGKNASRIENGWSMVFNPVGTYGTAFLKRAYVAFGGLGANVVEDAIYPTALAQGDKQPFESGQKYVVHFSREQIPPANAFWSLTMYNEKQFFAANPINRYAIGDRDNLKFNPDGSLDLYIQRDSPGPDKESNWLPAPKDGTFTMNLRLYWPKASALDGQWAPPAVQQEGGSQLRPTGSTSGGKN